MNTLVGAFAVDVTHSSTDVKDEGTLTGQSYSINYSKSFDATDTTFSVTGYRFSSENYLSMNDALSLQNTLDDYAEEHNTDQQSAMHAYSRTRNEVQANIYQTSPSTRKAMAHSILTAPEQLLGRRRQHLRIRFWLQQQHWHCELQYLGTAQL